MTRNYRAHQEAKVDEGRARESGRVGVGVRTVGLRPIGRLYAQVCLGGRKKKQTFAQHKQTVSPAFVSLTLPALDSDYNNNNNNKMRESKTWT